VGLFIIGPNVSLNPFFKKGQALIAKYDEEWYEK
jgi:hypothetical protein